MTARQCLANQNYLTLVVEQVAAGPSSTSSVVYCASVYCGYSINYNTSASRMHCINVAVMNQVSLKG